jgi:NAD(P)-dependent dehydrogenase (short-subunit alcohol dehydrogenase family)
MCKRFEGKIALVTGAAGGIGRAAALAFAKEGAKVVVADIQVEGGQQTVAQIQAAGGEALFVQADVRIAAEVEALIQTTVDTYGRLDCAYNNAATEGIPGLTADCTEENFDRVIGTNLKGIWLCLKYEIPVMLKQGGGSIVNCSSLTGLIGFPNVAAYTASKHGVLGLTKAAALEYAKSGIRINAVCPGVIDTEMANRFAGGNPDVLAYLATLEPVGRLGKPEEVAAAVLWLSSPEASFVLGAGLTVDAGMTIQ